METTYTTLEHKGQPKVVRGIDRQLLFGRVGAHIRRIDQGFWKGKGVGQGPLPGVGLEG
jgi:hypothetical protein